jgi:acyl-CoA synthetase (AMP-forming)/AMP-acid ligase II
MWFEEVARHAAAHGGATAVSDERRSLTYVELVERASRLAGGLRGAGLEAGDRVGLLSRNSVEAVEALVALSLAGAVAVPLNHRLTPHELAGLAAGIDLRAAIGEGALLGPLATTSAADKVWSIDGPEWEAMATTTDPIALAPRDPAAPELGLLTSGTTSSPKCAVLSGRAVRASALSWLASVRPSGDDVYFSCTPLFHSTVMISIAYLGVGAHLALVRGFTPQRAIETIARRRVTQMYMVPSMLALTLRARGLEGQDFSSLLDIFHGGEPIDSRLREEAGAAFDARLRDCFGQAQAGGPIAVTDGSPEEQGSVGRPLHGVEVWVGEEPGRPAPPGEAAEVWVRSDALMDGYAGRPQDTAAVLRDGWLRTGDLGHLDRRGALRLVGRASDTIIRGGQNVYPSQVEEVILGVDGVEDAAVFGVADGSWGEVPVAAIVESADASPPAAELAALCRDRLAPYKRPVAFTVYEELPRNAAGKVRKGVLRASFEAASEPEAAGAP